MCELLLIIYYALCLNLRLIFFRSAKGWFNYEVWVFIEEKGDFSFRKMNPYMTFPVSLSVWRTEIGEGSAAGDVFCKFTVQIN